eukprot:CAMPEP_0203684824 /NCGR_PEP_ID=MMETSP0090-20130426/48234_1 /ASSEMBLY_ACC=CAM_ASM_001088 /TAXON_ID=426623 /ORGANISM="Chaetoceros affinis, Strain CCMP159" /LENGTH=727 /DNA_ID=CAMNT_0050554005 /DNA_START=368 /DNA_END=2552 /DNA_ORIENTATION=-
MRESVNRSKLVPEAPLLAAPKSHPGLDKFQIWAESIDHETLPHPPEQIDTIKEAIQFSSKVMEYGGTVPHVLLKYLRNIWLHPSEPKYRRIRIRNKVFFNNVWTNNGSRGMLYALGFEVRGRYIEMSNVGSLSEESLKHLTDAIAKLEKLVKNTKGCIQRGLQPSSATAGTNNVPRKSRWGAKVEPLRTKKSSPDSFISSYFGGISSSSLFSPTFKIQHIPSLPSSEYAQSILERIQNEFQILVQKRGYNVASVTEMCCCDDGLNYLPHDHNIRTEPDNIDNLLGYNETHGDRDRNNSITVHKIHLRLRYQMNHGSFYPYEDIAATMCHELAHCEVGDHSAKFYKVMDEIIDQYSTFLVSGVVVDKSGFPIGNDQAYILGTSKGHGDKRGLGSMVKQRLEQKRKLGIGRSYVLGGGKSYVQEIKRQENEQKKNGFNIYGDKSMGINQEGSSTLLPPQEAALKAAERRVEERQRIDSQFCQPCKKMVQLLDWSSSDEEEDDDDNDNDDENESVDVVRDLKQTPEDVNSKDEICHGKNDDGDNDNDNENESVAVVRDLKQTPEDEIDHKDDNSDNDHVNSKDENLSWKETQSTNEEETSHQQWNCPSCTFINKPDASLCKICGTGSRLYDNTTAPELERGLANNKKMSKRWTCSRCTFAGNEQLSSTCEACGTERNPNEATNKLIERMVRQDIIEDVKSKENERSQRDFNGFNIYREVKKSSSTMKHLT